MGDATSSWQWTPVEFGPHQTPDCLSRGPLTRSTINNRPTEQSRSPNPFNLFGSLRRSLREVGNPFAKKNSLSRLPGTPRLVRSKKGAANSCLANGYCAPGVQHGAQGSFPPHSPYIASSTFVCEPGVNGMCDMKPPPYPVSSRSSAACTPEQRRRAEDRRMQDRFDNMRFGFSEHPPGPKEAEHDLFAHLQTLLNPDALSNRRTPNLRRKALLTEQPAKDTNFHDGDCSPGNLEPVEGDRRRPGKASEESLISLMSSSGGTSGLGASQGPLSPRRPRRGLRSVSSGASSRGSYGQLPIKQYGARPNSRIYSVSNGLPLVKGSNNGSEKSFGEMSEIIYSTLVSPNQLPKGLTIRPLFTLELSQFEKPETPYLGREWLCREIHETLLRNSGDWATAPRVILIHGDAGSGKTAFVNQLALQSPFHSLSNHLTEGTKGSLDSGIASGSRLSLSKPQPGSSTGTSSTDWFQVIARTVVGYHFCRIESNAHCGIPEFVCNLAAQLAVSPFLRSYAEYIAEHNVLQEALKLENCLQHDPFLVFRDSVAKPLSIIKTPDVGPLLLLVDGLSEAEFHRPESHESITSFLIKVLPQLPSWIRLVLTIRSDSLDLFQNVGCRRITLDDALLDERVWRDAKLYVDYRLAASETLQKQLVRVNGLGENVDPLAHFAQHVVDVSKGNFLYLRLTLDLLERGQLRPKSVSYNVLPVNIAEALMLMFNLKFPSVHAYESVSGVLSVILAALRPLTHGELYDAINAGRTDNYFTWDEFTERLLRVGEFLVQRADSSYVLFHTILRDWLVKRPEGQNSKFLIDVRQGHMLLALRLSRRRHLGSDEAMELGHHLLKAHPYKNLSKEKLLGASGKDCQLLWIQQSCADLKRVLCSDRNFTCPNTKVSRLLLLAGADPDARMARGDEPLLCRASSCGHADMCALLLEFGATLEIREPEEGRTPLMLAAAFGHLDVVQLLHQHGAKLCQADNKGRCALVHAAECGQVQVVSFLLQCDWSANTVGSSPSLKSHASASTFRQQAVQQSFVKAAAAGKTKVCRFLLEMAEVSMDEPDPFSGETALCAACLAAQKDSTHYLLSCGAALRSRKARGLVDAPGSNRPGCGKNGYDSPLLCSVIGGSWEIVSTLLSKGLQADGDTSFTPLMAAAKHGHIGVLELLLSRNANVNAVDEEGRTALSWSCVGNRPACATLLMDRGSPIDTVDCKGSNLLHLAAEYASSQLVHLLLERGISLEQPDLAGHRPLDIAIHAKNLSALACFLRRGAKLGANAWVLARNSFEITLILLRKLTEDGNLLYRRSRVKDAIHRYSYALKKFPGADSIPARILDGAKPGEKAEELRRKSDEVRYDLLLGLARCKRRLAEFEACLDLCTQAQRYASEGGGFEMHLLRAKCHFDMQNCGAARGSAEEAARLNPTSSEARHLLDSLNACSIPVQTHSQSQSQLSLNKSQLMNYKNCAASVMKTNGSIFEQNLDFEETQKSISPAECSSDSGNQADFEERKNLQLTRPFPTSVI